MMKKLIALIGMVLLLSSCMTVDYSSLDARVKKLEAKSVMGMASGAGANFYPFRAISGGAAGALDKLDGNSIALGDVGFVTLNADASYGTTLFVYVYRDYGGAVSESLPYIVKPDNNPNANYAWSLATSGTSPAYVATGNLTATAAILRSGLIQQTAAGTITLPTAASVGYGTPFCIIVRDASETCTIDLDGSEKFNLYGTALAAGNTLDSPGAAGDYVCLVAVSDTDGSGTDGYWVLGYGKTAWTDGGAT
jgi:hypothetical protein